MCHWLAAERPKLRDQHRAVLRGQFSKLGNPKAQARFIKRLRNSPGMNWRLLTVGLVPGKRGKCALQWLTWTVVTPSGEEVREGDPMPPKPWLTCLLEVIWIKDKEASFSAPLVTFTHHAMQRLAERCEARTVPDMLAALRDLALWTANPENDCKAQVIRAPCAGGIAVIEDTPVHGLLVTTVLEAGWVVSGGELVPDAQVGPDVAER